MNCLDCVYHKIIPDHNPWNDACIDDQAVVCILQPNDKEDFVLLEGTIIRKKDVYAITKRLIN